MAIWGVLRAGIEFIVPALRTDQSICAGVARGAPEDELLFLSRFRAYRRRPGQRNQMYDWAFGEEVRALLDLYLTRLATSGRWNLKPEHRDHFYEEMRMEFCKLFDRDAAALQSKGISGRKWVADWRMQLGRTLNQNRNTLKGIATALADIGVSRRLGR